MAILSPQLKGREYQNRTRLSLYCSDAGLIFITLNSQCLLAEMMESCYMGSYASGQISYESINSDFG